LHFETCNHQFAIPRIYTSALVVSFSTLPHFPSLHKRLLDSPATPLPEPQSWKKPELLSKNQRPKNQRPSVEKSKSVEQKKPSMEKSKSVEQKKTQHGEIKKR
jgi:hypothetical protein